MILECIEAGLVGALGKSSEAATLYFVQIKGGLKLSLIPGDPEGFVDTMRTIFGLGSGVLLGSILRELRVKEAGLKRERVLHEFAEVVERGIKSVEAGIA